MTKALAIAKRDLRVLFGGPLAWTVIGAFTFLAGYFFYTDVTFYVLFGGGNLPMGLWRYVFMHDRLVALLVLPLVTMRRSGGRHIRLLGACPSVTGRARRSCRRHRRLSRDARRIGDRAAVLWALHPTRHRSPRVSRPAAARHLVAHACGSRVVHRQRPS